MVGSAASLSRVQQGFSQAGVSGAGQAELVYDTASTLWGLFPPAFNHPRVLSDFSNNDRYIVFDKAGNIHHGSTFWSSSSYRTSPPGFVYEDGWDFEQLRQYYGS